jgi:hypothetical protein
MDSFAPKLETCLALGTQAVALDDFCRALSSLKHRGVSALMNLL